MIWKNYPRRSSILQWLNSVRKMGGDYIREKEDEVWENVERKKVVEMDAKELRGWVEGSNSRALKLKWHLWQFRFYCPSLIPLVTGKSPGRRQGYSRIPWLAHSHSIGPRTSNTWAQWMYTGWFEKLFFFFLKKIRFRDRLGL